MPVPIDLSFPHDFACELPSELPPGQVRRFPPAQRAGQDGVLVRVTPSSGDAWTGMFAFGTAGPHPSVIVAMPDPNKLCVVARGKGYLVDARRPHAWEAIEATPVTDLRAAAAAGLVVFATHVDLVAYGRDGVRWRTPRLGWDRLHIISVHERTLVGEGFDVRDGSTQRFDVDLTNGIARGGLDGWSLQTLAFPEGLVGQTVTGIARVLYEWRGALDDTDGDLELELNGRLVLLDCASDGERLRVKEARWEDPFAEPLSDENRAYVAEAGKWRRVDCSHQGPYRDLIGQRITDVLLLRGAFGVIAGVRISVASRSLWFVAEGDESHVYWEQPGHITEMDESSFVRSSE